MWNHPGPGTKLVFPALAGRFLTTCPPAKGNPMTVFGLPWLLRVKDLLDDAGDGDSIPGPG